MKGFPFTSPELGFILFVMMLPLVVGLVWRSETLLGFLGRVGVGMAVGFGIWLGLVFAVGSSYDRKANDEKTQA